MFECTFRTKVPTRFGLAVLPASVTGTAAAAGADALLVWRDGLFFISPPIYTYVYACVYAMRRTRLYVQ